MEPVNKFKRIKLIHKNNLFYFSYNIQHDVRCSCHECLKSRSEDSLRYSKSRINAYKALASPSLISLSSKDPILTAFQLSWELKRLSRIENEFKSDYEKLSLQCQEYASALLAETRTSQELEIILNHDHENPPALFENEQEKTSLNRLKLAIKYKQKKVNFIKQLNYYLNLYLSKLTKLKITKVCISSILSTTTCIFLV